MSRLLQLLIAALSAWSSSKSVEDQVDQLRWLELEIRRVARQESLKVWHAAMRIEKKKLEELGDVDPWDPDQDQED